MGVKRYYVNYSLNDGLGRPSISLYLTGCDKPIKCFNCHNYELQKDLREDYDIDHIYEEVDKMIKNFLDFNDNLIVSYLGGDPLTKYNRDILYKVSKYVKEKYPQCTNIMYTWRYNEDILKSNLSKYIKYIDIGVLGGYDHLKFIEKTIPSSNNQIIYDYRSDKELDPIKIK